MGKQHYLTYEERLKIEAWLRAKAKVTWIASQIGCSRQTIYNEIKRGQYIHTCEYWDEVRYSADIAQQKTDYNQSAKGRPLKIGSDYAYADFLEQTILKKKYSPAAALAEARKHDFDKSICVTTLYSYIEKRVFAKLSRFLTDCDCVHIKNAENTAVFVLKINPVLKCSEVVSKGYGVT